MASSSSSSSRRYDVFPSFSGENVRKGFLSHLLKEFERESINTFLDNGIERSRTISREILPAIREAKIAIVIFTKNYASSTWCLDELVEIHMCSKELNQMVIPVFYDVDPADVRKQTGEFGESFLKTCKGKTDDEIQSWIQALTDVANLPGEHLEDWLTEADMVEEIANDVLDKLISPPNGFGDLIGIEAHIEAMESILCLESEEVRMVGIWGQSGIGKSTLARALFSHLSPKFPFYAFLTYKSPNHDVFGMKLFWERRLLVETFGNNIGCFGMVEHMFKDKQVLIVLDDVVNPEYLETLAGKTEWFGPGSRIIVITQDKHILKGHKIDLLYEVKIPNEDIALKIFCRSAFVQDSPPEDFKELAHEVVRLAGGLPLGLRVLGHSLKGRAKEEWMDLLSGLKNGLKGDIMKTLRVSYDRLDEKEQDLFLWIACLFNGESVNSINNFFRDGNSGLKRLAEKSLIRVARNGKMVEMHNLLEKLGREIVRAESKDNPGKRRFLTDAKEIAESKDNPGKRRFLTDAKEIEDVLANQTVNEGAPNLPFNNPGIVAAGPNTRNLHLERDQKARRDQAGAAVIPNSRFLARRPMMRPPPSANSPKLETPLFSIAVNYPPTRVTYPSNSTYVPNFSSTLYYVNTMDQLMASTKNWADNCSGWVPPYSQIYISMLLYFQVMRAMEKAGVLRPSSEISLLLRDVSLIYPFENLMVPGPLVCLFDNLTAFHPFSNGSFGNVTPFIPNRPGWSRNRCYSLCNQANYHLPNVSLMIFRLHQTCAASAEENQTDITFQEHLNCPQRLSTLFQVACDNGEFEEAIMASPGAGLAYPGDLHLWREANSQLQPLDFPNSLNRAEDNPLDNWASFLNLDNELSWFGPVAAMMNKYCQYWRGSVPLSSISADGSAAGSVICSARPDTSLYDLADWIAPQIGEPPEEGQEPPVVQPGYYTLNPNPTLTFDARTVIEDIPQANIFAAMTYQFNLLPFNVNQVPILSGKFWDVRPDRHVRNENRIYASVNAVTPVLSVYL